MSSYNLTHLKQLEAESIYIIREVAAEFDNPVEAFQFVGNTGPKFDYSPSASAVRVGDDAVPLPKQPAARRECTYKECDRQARGHKNHYIPVLRAMNQRYC